MEEVKTAGTELRNLVNSEEVLFAEALEVPIASATLPLGPKKGIALHSRFLLNALVILPLSFVRPQEI